MKWLTLCLITAALAVSPLAAEVQTNDKTDLLMVVYVPCALNGVGESVELSGTLHVLITATITGNNVSGKWHYQPQGVSGVGMTSGLKYQATGVTQQSFKGSLQNGQYVAQYVNNFRIIGQGPGNNYLVHETMHLTINANGEVTVTHDNFSMDCK